VGFGEAGAEFAGVEVLVGRQMPRAAGGHYPFGRQETIFPISPSDLELLASFGASTALAVKTPDCTPRPRRGDHRQSHRIYNHRYMFKYLSDLMDGRKKISPFRCSTWIWICLSSIPICSDIPKATAPLSGCGNQLEAVESPGHRVRFFRRQFYRRAARPRSHQAHVIAEKIRSDVEKAFFSDVK
jgi:hypothetical protein